MGKSELHIDRSAILYSFAPMKYAVLIEPVEESDGMPGFYYAHVPSLGITTHGGGIEGAMAAARDLISLWVESSSRPRWTRRNSKTCKVVTGSAPVKHTFEPQLESRAEGCPLDWDHAVPGIFP